MALIDVIVAVAAELHAEPLAGRESMVLLGWNAAKSPVGRMFTR